MNEPLSRLFCWSSSPPMPFESFLLRFAQATIPSPLSRIAFSSLFYFSIADFQLQNPTDKIQTLTFLISRHFCSVTAVDPNLLTVAIPSSSSEFRHTPPLRHGRRKNNRFFTCGVE
ncbi:hypothetical protein CMV_016551 [Castanea mollissima]|uniref:Uncharacterized protein n=1 Tax=Castanea mollissima TaxID=60419 RepID=A0A8J4R7L4_9ROSI|nr:hypothetical protein CMV_016551 [Castanea mollissima]